MRNPYYDPEYNYCLQLDALIRLMLRKFLEPLSEVSSYSKQLESLKAELNNQNIIDAKNILNWFLNHKIEFNFDTSSQKFKDAFLVIQQNIQEPHKLSNEDALIALSVYLTVINSTNNIFIEKKVPVQNPATKICSTNSKVAVESENNEINFKNLVDRFTTFKPRPVENNGEHKTIFIP